MNFEERLKIQEGIARLANSFDIQDWDALQAGLTESRDADYSDVRGTPPQTMTVSEYLRQRLASLDHLKLQYLVSNYDVDFMDAEFAAWRASMVAWWAAEEKDFTSHGSGMFQWMKQDGGWKINGITQKFYGMRGHLSS